MPITSECASQLQLAMTILHQIWSHTAIILLFLVYANYFAGGIVSTVFQDHRAAGYGHVQPLLH